MSSALPYLRLAVRPVCRVHGLVGSVPTDLDIHRTARLLIDRQGEDTPIHAAMKADELLVRIATQCDGVSSRMRSSSDIRSTRR